MCQVTQGDLRVQQHEAFRDAVPKALYLARMYARPADREDFESTALMTLWEASLTWIPDIGPLWGFARFHVRHALLDEMRRTTSPLSRDDFGARPGVLASKDRLRERLGREPSDVEVAEDLGESVKKVTRIRQSMRPVPVAEFDDLSNDDEPQIPMSLPVDLDSLELRDLFTVLRYTGLDDASPMSIRQIAEQLGESHETTRSRLRRILG